MIMKQSLKMKAKSLSSCSAMINLDSYEFVMLSSKYFMFLQDRSKFSFMICWNIGAWKYFF